MTRKPDPADPGFGRVLVDPYAGSSWPTPTRGHRSSGPTRPRGHLGQPLRGVILANP
nr:hypothetical protein Iba_chr08dCG5870 [Ipomoea batatas]